MNLTQLRLENYRCFSVLEIDFHPEVTVIVAPDGESKTAILEAIASALGPFVGAFDHGKSTQIAHQDARYATGRGGNEDERQYPVIIQAEALTPQKIQWQRALISPKARTTIKGAEPLANWGKQLQTALRKDSRVTLPVVCYHSLNRLWVPPKTAGRGALTGSRTAGYQNALSSDSTYIQLRAWMRTATLAALQQSTCVGYERSNLPERLALIKNAVDTVTADDRLSNFHYSLSLDNLAMSHREHGDIPLESLSDGDQAVILLVADLALRCIRLNGGLGVNVHRESTGIALIDEPDLDLSPALQLRVLKNLREAFPKIQFILGTCNSRLLSKVKGENIRVISQDHLG